MLKRSLLATLAALVLAVLAIAPTASAAPPTATAPATLPVSGTIAGVTGGTFTGQLTNLQFVNQNGNLAVVGQLTGTLTNAAGAVLGTVTNVPVTLPVTGAQAGGSCQILDLTLGPLDLDLLGLVVHLDTVHLNITAQQGPGNLLGNLLCGITNALNGGGGGGLSGLLNRLLGL